MAYSYKTAIGFGLVYIPVVLHSAIKNNDIGFNMLDKKTKSRIQYKKTCAECNNREVKNEDIVKGYPLSKDEYIIFTPEELEKLKTKKDKNVVIEKFVDLTEINPIYFDRTFYLAPEKKEGERAFFLLKSVLKSEHKVGIAKTMLGASECVVAVWVSGEDLVLSRLFFADEVQANPASKIDVDVGAKELSLAKNIIDAMADKLDMAEYKDEYNLRLKQAIAKKASGKQITAAERENKIVRITDLMEALKSSVAEIKTYAPKSKISKKPLKNDEKPSKTPHRSQKTNKKSASATKTQPKTATKKPAAKSKIIKIEKPKTRKKAQ